MELLQQSIEWISHYQLKWPSTENKVRLQQFFIKWLSETYKDRKPVYLGGSHVDNLSACLRVSEGHVSYVRLLKCGNEEADDRIMFHINHAVIMDQFQKVIVASADTDVHNLVRFMKSVVVDVLPAVHALSGCDTTSKVGTKKSALQAAEETGHEQ